MRGGRLVNREERKGRPYKLTTGDQLPASAGLPSPDDLVDWTHNRPTSGTTPECADLQGEQPNNCATDDINIEPPEPLTLLEEGERLSI